MDQYEQLKARQTAALIVVLTFGIAAVPLVLNWKSNSFEGTSFDQGPLHILCRVVSFLLLTALMAIPAFFIYLIVFIVTTIQLFNYHH